MSSIYFGVVTRYYKIQGRSQGYGFVEVAGFDRPVFFHLSGHRQLLEKQLGVVSFGNDDERRYLEPKVGDQLVVRIGYTDKGPTVEAWADIRDLKEAVQIIKQRPDPQAPRFTVAIPHSHPWIGHDLWSHLQSFGDAFSILRECTVSVELAEGWIEYSFRELRDLLEEAGVPFYSTATA